MIEDARRFNMDEASIVSLIETLRDPVDLECDGIWPEHVAIVEAFLAVNTQWRIVPVGGGGFAPAMPLFIGLDYAAVRVGLEAEGIIITQDLWRGLRVMENAARIALNEAS